MFKNRGFLRLAGLNSLWLFAEKFVILGSSFVVSIFLARYLGPTEFGLLNYSLSIVAIIATINYLGLGGSVVKEIVERPEDEDVILGTVFVLKFIASFVSVFISCIIAYLVVNDGIGQKAVVLISLSMPFESLFFVRLFFEARLASRAMVVATSTGAIIGIAARLVAILSHADLLVFALIIPAQSAVTALGLLMAYRRLGGRIGNWRFRIAMARSLLKNSWPLILSSAGAVVYLKIDQFMIGEILGMSAVGTYAVAARLSEVWYFVPVILAGSIFPRLVQLRNSDKASYEQRIKQAFRLMFWISLAIAIPISLCSSLFITFLYGPAFRDAATILSIHVWTCPAVFMGAVLQKWLLAENLLIYSLTGHILGAAVNVGLNLVLIPAYGGVGAAVSTLIAYTIASYFACLLQRPTFTVGLWMTEAIFWPFMPLARRLAFWLR